MALKDDKYIRALTSSLFPLPEYDVDEDTENLPMDAEQEADIIDIVDHIGTSDFKYIYLNCNYFFMRLSIDTQIKFCMDIITKIQDTYDYNPPQTIYYNTIKDVYYIYKLLEFIEYDNVFFTRVLMKGVGDLRMSDPTKFILDNWGDLDMRSNKIAEKLPNPRIVDFLVTNSKINLVQFFSRLIRNNMIEVISDNIIKIKKGVNNG